MGRFVKYNLTDEQKNDLQIKENKELLSLYGWNDNKVAYLRRKYSIRKKKKKLTDSLTQQEVQDLHDIPTPELKKKYGWTCQQIDIYRVSLKIKDYPKARIKGIPSPHRQELEGLTVAEIMKRFDVVRGTATKWLRNYQITPAKDQRIEGLKDTIEGLELKLRNMRMLYAMPFLRDVEIARAFNISRERVRQIRNKHNIPCVIRMKEDV